MTDFVNEFVQIVTDVIGQTSFSIYYGGSSVWSIQYAKVCGYALCILAVTWLAVVSVRMFRKMLMGVM